jgi:hypothetical protein
VQHVVNCVREFLCDAEENGAVFFNEQELQHELGYWLRTRLLDGTSIRFERPASSFVSTATGLVKKEIDLAISGPNSTWNFAIELKCPRNGRVPETMFDACKDIQFLEQLTSAGFSGAMFLMHVDDPEFYEAGRRDGIYAYFRAGIQIPPVVTKPTGAKDKVVYIRGHYRVSWQPFGARGRYWLQLVTPANA